MNIQKLMLIPVGAAAILCATCAPVDSPSPRDGEANGNGPPAEQLDKAPSPIPAEQGQRVRLEAAIQHVRQRELNTKNGFWTIFHGILGLGPGLTLRDAETGQKINAVDYICSGGELRGMAFPQTKWGLDVQLGPTFIGQGHQDQFVAEMGQWGMAADRPFVVNGRDYTFLDFVNHSKMRARTNANQELSWTICLVGQYLGTDIAWTNSHGEKLHFEDLIQYELDASVEQAACGGTHRLFGLNWAYHHHLIRGGKKEGVWQGVADKTAKYRDLAKKYQNPDGSFSTDFFRGRGNAEDKNLRINTTGHTLEWLALALSDEDLKQPWVQEAASALSLMILDLQGQEIEGGSLYHAVHGLLLYYSRVYGRNEMIPQELLCPLPPDWAAATGS
jgi:hypothetical protein